MTKLRARIILLIIASVTAFFSVQLNSIKFNYDFDMFFPEGDKDLVYYQKFADQFGTDNDNLLISISDRDVLSFGFLSKLDTLIRELEKWPETTSVQGLSNLFQYQLTPLGINRVKIINPNLDYDQTHPIWTSDKLTQFISNDRQSTLIFLAHIPFIQKEEADSFYAKLTQLLRIHDYNFIVSGKIEAQNEFVRKLESELKLLLLLAVSFVCLTLFILYKKLLGVILPLLVLIVTCIWIVGFAGIMGKDMDVMMVMVPPILLVVAMSDVIHFTTKFRELQSHEMTIANAIKATFNSVGKATFLTSISTAIGFACLAVSPIPPIRDFGIYTAIGVIIAYIITFSLLPSFFFLRNRGYHLSVGTAYTRWHNILSRMFLIVIKKRKQVLVLTLTITILLATGIVFLKRNTHIIVGLRKSDPLLEKVAFFDNQYGGSKTFEMVVNLRQGSLFEKESLNQLMILTSFIEGNYDLSNLRSPLEIIKDINQGLKGGLRKHHIVPSNSRDLQSVEKAYLSKSLKRIRSSVQNTAGTQLRLSGIQKDVGSAEARKRNKLLSEFYKQHINPETLSYRLTGTSFLIDKTDTYVSESLLKGLALGLLLISIILAVLFKSLRLALISLAPNIIPLLILGGILGYFQVELNITTTLIFSIAFGIAVDDSIHFMSRFQLERKSGLSRLYALKRSYLSTGKSLILTSLILCAGFMVFVFSTLSATYFMGVFVGLTLLIALIADLSLLPIMLLPKSKVHQD